MILSNLKFQNDFIYMEQENFSSFDFFTSKTTIVYIHKRGIKQKPRQNFKD